MNIIPTDLYECAKRLWKVLKFNHGLDFANRIVHEMFDNGNYNVFEDEDIDITEEFETYRKERDLNNKNFRITQLALPHRFGMYKSLKNHAKVEHIELEEPKDFLDSTASGIIANPNHKRRSIF